jgi:CRP-like cAMP-binding protein
MKNFAVERIDLCISTGLSLKKFSDFDHCVKFIARASRAIVAGNWRTTTGRRSSFRLSGGFMNVDLTAALKPLVRKLELHGPLDKDDREGLLGLPWLTRVFKRREYISREGESVTKSWVLLSGLAQRHKLVADGNRQIVSFHMKGDLIDLENTFFGRAAHSIQCLTQGEAAFIPASALQELAFERPNIGKALWADTLLDGAISREWIANVGRRPARLRVAHLLCELGVRFERADLNEATEYDLPVTQEEIGDATGLTSVHVNRMLRVLEEDGLITRGLRHSITIHSWQKLARAGDFNSAYLNMHEKPGV